MLIVLIKVIICPLEFKTFNKYIITNYEIKWNDFLIIGDFLILKWYYLTLNRAEAVYCKYKAYYTTKCFYLINV